MTQHTPGPWHCHHWPAAAPELNTARESAFVVKARRISSLAESDADARLIAAAPDLLPALREAADLIAWQADHSTGEHKARLRGAMVRARAAIAKAEGV